MQRYAYIEPIGKQVIFNQTQPTLTIIRKNTDNLLFIKQKKDEQSTVQALQKKYKIKILQKAIHHTPTQIIYGYIVQEKT